MPLRQGVSSLSRTNRVAMLVDRRVDPEQKIDIRLNGLTLEETLAEIARSRGLGVSQLGPVIYIGPPSTASRIRTLAALVREQLLQLPNSSRKFFLPKRLRWDDFATPRSLLETLTAEGGMNISGLDRVPHDLWAAADLPPLALVDRIALIAVQFDLTFQVDPTGRTISLVPVPDYVALVRSYPAGQEPRQLIEKWQALVPDAQIRQSGNKIFVRGLVEDHQRIAESMRPLHRPTPNPTTPNNQEPQLTAKVIRKTVNQILTHFTGQLQMELQIDQKALDDAGISLDREISFSVKDATIDELFEAVLKPVGCTFRRKGNLIEVRPDR